MNKINTWRQGYFVDQRKYHRWTQEEKDRADKHENLLVRPSPTGNALCKCNEPEDAEWIAARLNRISNIERLLTEFHENKFDGNELLTYIFEEFEKD